MCFWVFFVFERGEKRVEKLGREKTQQKMVSSQSEGCPGLFIAPAQILRRRPIKGCPLQKHSNGFDLDMSRRILTFLEGSLLPVSKNVWILKIQWLDQKLWLSKVSGALIGVLSWFS